MVAKRHKITNVPLFKKIWDIIIFFWDNNFLSRFSEHFEGASTFLTPSKWTFLTPSKCPLKRLKKLLSRKKNYVPHFLKQRDINSYFFTPLFLLLLFLDLGWTKIRDLG